MASGKIESIKIRGFRSLANVEISDMPQATVLIGANGSGKSNFIRFFDMLSWMLRSRQLQEYIQRQGGADDQLFGGNAQTPRIEAEIQIRTEQGRNDYKFYPCLRAPRSIPVYRGSLCALAALVYGTEADWQFLKSGHLEAEILEAAHSSDYVGVNKTTAFVIAHLLRNCSAYHFHDTSDTSAFKNSWDASENRQLRSHGGNLAAVLYRLEQQDLRRYERICRQIGRVLPGFDRFDIVEDYGKVLLRWRAKWTDKAFGAHLTSDGSLRFFALVTLLNLPPEMLPDVIMLDEPELGLHPAAIALIGGLIKSVSAERQLIVATQSPLLVDAFDVDEIFVLDIEDGKTICRKLESANYRRWLEDGYTPGDLWRKNLVGGRP